MGGKPARVGRAVAWGAAWLVAAMAAASLVVAAESDRESAVRQTVAENILLYQRESGGWPKHYDRRQVLNQSERQRVLHERSENDATIDNGATHTEIRMLAKIFRRTTDPRVEAAALRGIRYLLNAQYDHGGWPQRFPEPRGYSRYITFNDRAMIGVMSLLRDIAVGDEEFSFVPVAMRARCRRAVERGIECLLKCQIRVDGTPTVWCAQHDHVTFEPRKARSYELPSLSGAESVGIVRFLTQIEDPSDDVTRAIENALRWFERSKLMGIKVVRVKDPTKPKGFDKVVIDDPTAPPMWARFYDIKTNQPIFCSRDGIPRRTLAEISYERRNGYSWLGYYAKELLKMAPAVSSPPSRPVAEESGKPHADRRQMESGRPKHPSSDWRRLDAGLPIPDEGYCDQPYVVVTPDGNWLCTMTTGPGREGQGGQHIVSTISTDRGETWSPLVAIEPTDGPAASWVVPLLVPSGRVYGFYTYNGDRVETLPGQSKKIRADTLGWYCFKYSDDFGRSWSTERHRLPMRVTACDRANNWQGKVQIFWGIDKPTVAGRCALFAFTKLGRYMLENGEGWVFRSVNLLHEPDVRKLRWELLPKGDHGIRLPEFGSVQEEHNLVPIDDHLLYMVYRTTQGYPCQSYSDDQGRTWTSPEPMTYSPGGRRIKTSRACPKLWRCENGKYLFWFHNHGGRTYEGRNPAWICGGEVRDGQMFWSQPEILLYQEDPATRMSYPDLIEQDGRYWVTGDSEDAGPRSRTRRHAARRTLETGSRQGRPPEGTDS